MSNDPGAEDSPRSRDATLAFALQSLQEHERSLDKLICKLAGLRPQIDQAKKFHERFEEIEVRVADLEREIKRLTSYLR